MHPGRLLGSLGGTQGGSWGPLEGIQGGSWGPWEAPREAPTAPRKRPGRILGSWEPGGPGGPGGAWEARGARGSLGGPRGLGVRGLGFLWGGSQTLCFHSQIEAAGVQDFGHGVPWAPGSNQGDHRGSPNPVFYEGSKPWIHLRDLKKQNL